MSKPEEFRLVIINYCHIYTGNFFLRYSIVYVKHLKYVDKDIPVHLGICVSGIVRFHSPKNKCKHYTGMIYLLTTDKSSLSLVLSISSKQQNCDNLSWKKVLFLQLFYMCIIIHSIQKSFCNKTNNKKKKLGGGGLNKISS